jgi:hypothetical protein
MANVAKGLRPDLTPEGFSALWNFSKTLGDSITEIQTTRIMADAERLGNEGVTTWIEKVLATTKICTQNVEAQQTYIELWRELAKSGVLAIPHE